MVNFGRFLGVFFAIAAMGCGGDDDGKGSEGEAESEGEGEAESESEGESEPECTVAADCDDTDMCTTDDCVSAACVNTPVETDDSNACTTDSCDPATGVVSNLPITYIEEPFADNDAGWTLGTSWEIGQAAGSLDCNACPGQDPSADVTETADEGLAGASIGGCVGPDMAELTDFCLESPMMDLSTELNFVQFSYWRQVHSDYEGFMQNRVDVFDGVDWVTVEPDFPPQPKDSSCLNEETWSQFTYDVTDHAAANPSFQVRFCYYVEDNFDVYPSGGWSVDDVLVECVLPKAKM